MVNTKCKNKGKRKQCIEQLIDIGRIQLVITRLNIFVEKERYKQR